MKTIEQLEIELAQAEALQETLWGKYKELEAMENIKPKKLTPADLAESEWHKAYKKVALIKEAIELLKS